MDTAVQPHEYQSCQERILLSKFAANTIRVPRMANIWVIVRKCISSVEDIGKVVAGETVVCPHSAQSASKIVRAAVRGRHQRALRKQGSSANYILRIDLAPIGRMALPGAFECRESFPELFVRRGPHTEHPVKFIDFTVQKGCQLQRLAIQPVEQQVPPRKRSTRSP
jgi:hypothetical protein